MRWRLFPLFEFETRLADSDMTELVCGGSTITPNGGNISGNGWDVNTNFARNRSLSEPENSTNRLVGFERA
jgi:hypothetical protein